MSTLVVPSPVDNSMTRAKLHVLIWTFFKTLSENSKLSAKTSSVALSFESSVEHCVYSALAKTRFQRSAPPELAASFSIVNWWFMIQSCFQYLTFPVNQPPRAPSALQTLRACYSVPWPPPYFLAISAILRAKMNMILTDGKQLHT